MSDLAIGEVARRTGFNPSAIRYYEQAGVITKPRRSSGRRRYDESALQELRLVDAAKRAGFSLSEIRTLLHDFPSEMALSERWRRLASEKLREIDRLLAAFAAAKAVLVRGMDCACRSIEECPICLRPPLGTGASP